MTPYRLLLSRVGLSQNDAKAQYIAFVEELEGKK